MAVAQKNTHKTMNEETTKQQELIDASQHTAAKAGSTVKTNWTQLLKPKKTFQTLVSGPVMVTLPELEIIDTPEFQRLRRVRQLGSACMVYPTALHTRFDHSLGTLEMVERMIQHIKGNEHSEQEERDISPRQRALARIYALVHDITHIPFGHTIEDELGVLKRHDKNEPRINHFLGKGSRISGIIVKHFGEEFLTDLIRVYRWDEKPANWDGAPDDVFIHDLVSNTVCADLLDYLRRDDHFCNLGVGMSYPFLNYLYIGKESLSDESGEAATRCAKAKRVFVRLWKTQQGQPRRDVLSDLCRLLEARYLVAERVYFHHAKIITGAMLARAIQEAHKANIITEEKMWEHSDDTLVHELANLGKEAPLAARLAADYQNRRLYKCAFEYRSEDVKKCQAADHNENWQKEHLDPKLGDADERRSFENYLAELLSLNEGDVLVYYPDTGMNMKQAKMRVLWEGKQIPFCEINDPVAEPRLKAVLEAHERLWSIRVLVAPHVKPKQRALLKEICDVELFTQGAETDVRRQQIYEKIVTTHLKKTRPDEQLSISDMLVKVKAAAESLAKAAKDSRGKFERRVSKAIDAEFGSAKAKS
jgi:HD superfamily phosphohydrolase